MGTKATGFEIADFTEIDPQMCPCGPSRRAFVDGDGSMSLHKLQIQDEDRPHCHDTDEIYYIIACGPNAGMWLDGARYEVKPGQAIKIRGGIMHRADHGNEPMTVLVVVATGHGSPEAEMHFAD